MARDKERTKLQMKGPAVVLTECYLVQISLFLSGGGGGGGSGISYVVVTGVCRSFSLRSEMKWNRSEIFFASMRKKCFFHLFRIDVKRRNLKRNENEIKRKRNKK